MRELQVNELENINGGTWGQVGEALEGTLQIAGGAGLIVGGLVTQDPLIVTDGGDLLGKGIENIGEL